MLTRSFLLIWGDNKVERSFYECFIVGPNLPEAFGPLDSEVVADDGEGLEIVDVFHVEWMLMHKLKVVPHSLQVSIEPFFMLFYYFVRAIPFIVEAWPSLVQVIEGS